jgi:pyruvate/2-oxoglutarate dehydrogenase complex dihydrolipoamide dehydrogenase (E3) component
MPAKTLLASTERLGDVEGAAGVGVETDHAHVDIPAIIDRKRELVDYFAEDRVHDLERLRLVRGRARFVSRDTIEAGGRRIRAARFILATGSRIVAPPIPGLAQAGYLVSDDVLEMKAIPPAVAVIGGGPVGCEFAQYFARLGARVTLLQDGPHLLRNEDPDVAQAVAAALRAEGVDVVLDARIEHCATAGVDTVVS